MDVALDHVAAASKQEWLQRRAEWRNGVRFIDVEVDGMQIIGAGEATVHVRLSWQRVDEADMRSTELLQKWDAKNGPWQLVSEECSGGDPSLLLAAKPTKQ